MARNFASTTLRWCGAAAAAVLLLAANCAPLPPTSSVAIPPVPGGAARIWIYRNDAPNEPNQTPYARLNGQIVGLMQPNGAFYRDVPPGYLYGRGRQLRRSLSPS